MVRCKQAAPPPFLLPVGYAIILYDLQRHVVPELWRDVMFDRRLLVFQQRAEVLQKALKRSHATYKRNLRALLAAYRMANLETGPVLRPGLRFLRPQSVKGSLAFGPDSDHLNHIRDVMIKSRDKHMHYLTCISHFECKFWEVIHVRRMREEFFVPPLCGLVLVDADAPVPWPAEWRVFDF